MVADVPVGSRPIAIAVGREGVWVANADDGTVSHIDPATRKVVKTIGIGGDVSDVAIGFGSIWVANGNAGTVTRIDPALDAVEATIEVGGHSALAPRPVFSVATGEGGVWITSGARVLEVDPATNQVVRRVTLGSVVDLTVGEGAVWVTTISERLFRLDPSTGAVTTTISVPAQASEPTAAAGSLWAIVAIGRGEVWRFDPNTGSPKGPCTPATRRPGSRRRRMRSGPPTGATARSRGSIRSAVASRRPSQSARSPPRSPPETASSG